MTSPGGGSAGVSVRAGELVTHAGNVELVTDQLTQASTGARRVSLNGEAFGILIGFVGGWFQEQEQGLADKYQQMTDALSVDAQNLRNAAAGYQSSDQRSEQRLKRAATRASGGGQLPL